MRAACCGSLLTSDTCGEHVLKHPARPAARDYTRLGGRLHFLDCGDRFLVPGGHLIDAK